MSTPKITTHCMKKYIIKKEKKKENTKIWEIRPKPIS